MTQAPEGVSVPTAAEPASSERVALSLVSHTNVGKTTLARTLLRRDVGKVFDQAHVTEVAEAWALIETEGAELLLWDTPGFGDTARLVRRLRNEGNPLGWFLHQVWDKVTDRALWCSQEALRNVRQDADVVLYLVNAAEHPEEAGYVGLELDLLQWLDRPVLVLLNQTGDAPEDRSEELCRTWAEHLRPWRHVRGVLSLDAFTRCWVQEGHLLERVSELLPAEKRGAMAGLIHAWNGRNLLVLENAVAALANLLQDTAKDTEEITGTRGSGGKKRAQSALVDRLERRLKQTLDELVSVHGLTGEAASTVRERVTDFAVSGLIAMNEKEGAFWGGVISGAASGITAEIVSGGLTFGAGALLGALAGALGGAGLVRGLSMVKGDKLPSVQWETEFLDSLLRRGLVSYLAVAQFGRGRGEVDDEVLSGEPSPWRAAVDSVLARHEKDVAVCWRKAREGSDNAWQRMASLVDTLLREVLAARHPEAAGLLRVGPRG
jgi:GTPase SAR1 family protein